jgi:hypothetical protein
MASTMQTYINIYFTEIIIGVLIVSIIIVLISIFYVLVSGTDDEVIKKSRIKNQKKIQKMKYTKQFIKGVDGIDLDLKVSNKKNLL